MAFAQDDTAGDDTAAGDDAAGDEVADDTAEEVIDTWETTFVWEDIYPGTGNVTPEGQSNWSKSFKEADLHTDLVGMPTTALASPDDEGVNMLKMDLKGGWPIKWEDKTDKNAKAHFGNIGFLWIAEVGEEVDGVAPVLAAEQTTATCDKSSGTMVCTDLASNTTDGCENVDYSKNGNLMCSTVLDRPAVTCWEGSVDAVVADSLIHGMTMTATRPWVPTEARASAITLKNQTPQFFCEAVWINRDDLVGYAEQHCAALVIDIPVPEVDEPEEEVEEPTEAGANALYATALSLAAIAALAF